MASGPQASSSPAGAFVARSINATRPPASTAARAVADPSAPYGPVMTIALRARLSMDPSGVRAADVDMIGPMGQGGTQSPWSQSWTREVFVGRISELAAAGVRAR